MYDSRSLFNFFNLLFNHGLKKYCFMKKAPPIHIALLAKVLQHFPLFNTVHQSLHTGRDHLPAPPIVIPANTLKGFMPEVHGFIRSLRCCTGILPMWNGDEEKIKWVLPLPWEKQECTGRTLQSYRFHTQSLQSCRPESGNQCLLSGSLRGIR